MYKESDFGLIPKSWQIKKLSDIAERITSGSRGWAQYYSDEGALFIRIGNLTREHVNFRWEDIQRVDPPRSTEGNRTELKPGDMLISITADLGIIGVVPDNIGEAYINQHIAMVRIASSDIDPKWVGRFFTTFRGQEQFNKLNDSGAKAGLNLPTIGSLKCPLPDNTEQVTISKYVDGIEAKIENEKLVLRKYTRIKIGLMQDLLTGKVRVKVDEPKESAQDVGVHQS